MPNPNAILIDALRLAVKRCRCGGSGLQITWDMDGGPPYEPCEECAPYRQALSTAKQKASLAQPEAAGGKL